MLYGISKTGERLLATKVVRTFCPYCKSALVAKCGKIYQHHWAHKEATNCPYAVGMTQWHYNWLLHYDKLTGQGWIIEYYFDSIRFDAYHPQTKQAIEFQRTIDIDYFAEKINICRANGIRLFWLINPEVFANYVYTRMFCDLEQDAVFASRRGKRKIILLLETFLNTENIYFFIDFTRSDYLPRYTTDKLETFYSYSYRDHRFWQNYRYELNGDPEECKQVTNEAWTKNHPHPMAQGIYFVEELPLENRYTDGDRAIMFVRRCNCKKITGSEG